MKAGCQEAGLFINPTHSYSARRAATVDIVLGSGWEEQEGAAD